MTLLMSNYAKLYWLTSLDRIAGLFIFFFILFLIISIICFLVSILFEMEDDDNDNKKIRIRARKLLKYTISFSLISLIISVLVPSTKQAIIIITGGKAMDFIQSDTSINKIPGDVTKSIDYLLQKEINSLKSNETIRDSERNHYSGIYIDTTGVATWHAISPGIDTTMYYYSKTSKP